MQKENEIILLLKYIFSIFLWTIWWTIAIFIGGFFLLLSLLLPKKTHNILAKILSAILTYSVFIFPRHKGLKPKELPFPVIFVPNHVSFFDLFICGTCLPGYPRGFELKKFFSLPVYGWFITRFGMIPIEPENRKSVLKAINIAGEKLSKKERNILIMPEGKRTLNGELQEFKDGAFFLSKKFNVPIVPVVFTNLFKINNRTRILIKPGFCDIYLLPPVYPMHFKTEVEMKNYVWNLIKNKLNEQN